MTVPAAVPNATGSCLDAILVGSVCKLHEGQLLDTSVVHGDGTTTAAKKGGDNPRLQRPQTHEGRQGRGFLLSQLQRDRALRFCARQPQ
jgi:hypothetical protein